MIQCFVSAPRRSLAAIAAVCVALLLFGLYLQHSVGLEPCPMCVVQRYLLVCVAIFAGLASLVSSKGWRKPFEILGLASALSGAFVAARQSWLQWNPPDILSCGRDFYGMIESFPLSRAVPMIFRGSGDCAAIDWTFLGLSIANWSFLCFVAFAVLFIMLLPKGAQTRDQEPLPPG